MRTLLLAGIVVLTVSRAVAGSAPIGDAFLNRHCGDCHNTGEKAGGFDLAALPFDPADAGTLRRWERIYERVRDGEMPPAAAEQPSQAERDEFLAALAPPLLAADAADVAANGRVRGRRLTRTEYEHTLHDLLGIDVPLKNKLPEDRASHGFETVADGQQLSHHQLARYLDTADLALTEAFRQALKGDESFTLHCSSADLALRSRGNYRGPELRKGESISWPIGLQFFGRMKATEVPADGWYRITLRQVRAINPTDDGAVWGTLRSGTCNSNAPMLAMIGLVEAVREPRDLTFEAWIQKDHMLELRPNDFTLKKAATGATGGNVSFDGRDLEDDGYAGIAHRGIDIERIYVNADRGTVRGNLFDDVDAKKIWTASAQKLDQLVARFAKRAFRRPVTAEQIAPYQAIAREARAAGDSAPDALRAAYRAILCSPRFLTFVEAPGALDDQAIASRLSYALWVSLPDERLTQLAAAGELRRPEVLAGEVNRLLDDPKSRRFVESFTDQWLKLNQIDFTNPDTRLYPTFDPVVQESMLQETRAYVAAMLRDDLSITHFVDSDFAFLNGRLARHYRLEAATKAGAGLQKVSLPGGTWNVRGGLIGQGAILKVTADGTTTSPVVRGVFVNERILGEHIPPPPPGIPAIEPDIRGATSVRDQLAKHRSNASCAACHRTIDPPGFALENYDPVGVWRSRYGKGDGGAKVDPTGITPDGGEFDGLAAWKQIYCGRSEQLARGFATQFLTYSTGAPLRFSDEPALNQIAADDNRHGMRTIIRDAILSEVFLKK